MADVLKSFSRMGDGPASPPASAQQEGPSGGRPVPDGIWHHLTVLWPQGENIAVLGVTGSGKSSLAFETIYAEGHRRFVESLSSYARMFLGQLDKPDLDSVEGLSPAISIDQKTTSRNPRSTV